MTRDEGLFLHPELWVMLCWMAQVPAMDQLTMDDLVRESKGLDRPVERRPPPPRGYL